MPIYELECQKCSETVEVCQGFNDVLPTKHTLDTRGRVVQCGGELKRIISKIGNISFRGKGWTPKFFRGR